MGFIETGDVRDVLNTLCAKIEALEGRSQALRDLLVTTIGALPAESHQTIRKYWSMVLSDSMGQFEVPNLGTDLREHSSGARAVGYQSEWNALQNLLRDIAR